MLCVLAGPLLPLAARGNRTCAPAARTESALPDTLPAGSVPQAPDTLKHSMSSLREIRLLGQRPLAEKKLDRTIVHVDALLANAGGHAWDALENSPGVTVDENGTISLNGKNGVLVLIDDRPTYLTGGQLMNYLKALPASQLTQIELLPVPPARYPAGGGAGIIILRTRKAGTKGFQAQLSSTYAQGIYAKTNHSLNLLGQYGSWQINSMIGYSFTQNWYNSRRYRDYFMPDGSPGGSAAQDYLEESWQHSIAYSGGLEHKGHPVQGRGHTSWGILVNGSVNPYHEVGHYTDGFYDAQGKTDSIEHIISHFSSHTSDLGTNAHILRTLSHKGRTFSADADYVRYDQRPWQTESTTATTPGDTAAPRPGLETHQPFTANIYSGKADYTDQFGSRTFLGAGVQSTWSARRNSGTYLEGPPGNLVPNDSLDGTFRYDEQIRSAYVSLRREERRVSFQAGLRLENTLGKGLSTGNPDSGFRLDYTNLFPSVHALWSLDSAKRQQVGFSYSRRIDRPGYSELNPTRFFFDQNTYFSGNPALQPEFSNNIELSYTYLNRYTLTGSYSITHGSINQVFIADGANFYYYSINMDRKAIAGLSADISTPLTPAWTLNTHVEWMYEQYRSLLPGNIPLHKTLPYVLLSGSTRYAFKNGWSAEVSGLYRSDVLIAQSVLRPTGRLNLALKKKIWKDKGTLVLAASDVLRTGIVARYIYLPGARVHFSNVFDRRQVSLTFTYAFGKKVEQMQAHASGAAAEKARL
jgi:iron complex outermembrane receptor protein